MSIAKLGAVEARTVEATSAARVEILRRTALGRDREQLGGGDHVHRKLKRFPAVQCVVTRAPPGAPRLVVDHPEALARAPLQAVDAPMEMCTRPGQVERDRLIARQAPALLSREWEAKADL